MRLEKLTEKKLEDDKLKALEKLISGSLAASGEKIENMSTDQMIETILGSQWVEEELKNAAAPYYMLSKKENYHWLLDMNLRTFVKVPSGIEVIPIDAEGDNKMLCMIGHSAFLVPNELINCVGWN